jgi:predicted Zn-dependent protease
MHPSMASNPLRRLFALLLAAAMVVQPLAAQPLPASPDSRNNLPSLGDGISDDISVATERKIGDRIMRELRRDPDFLDDPVILEQLQPMWLALVEASRARGNIPPDIGDRFAWELFLVRDRNVNAFALPGGFVGLYLGLIALTATPDELASVLAHELSHITQRHIARSISAGKTSSFVGIAGLLLGVLVASRSPDAANALIAGGQAVAVQGQLNFSRDMEREADRVGYGVFTAAGYQPGGMAAMFEKLQQASRLNDSQNFPYLRTHPLTTARIGEARARLGVDGVPVLPRSLSFAVIRARARVLMDTRDVGLQRAQEQDLPAWQVAQSEPADRLSGLYGSALASMLRSDWKRVDAALAAARPLAAPDKAATFMLDLLKLDALIARNDAAGATALLERLLAAPAAPRSRALLLSQAQVALLPASPAPDARVAAERLQTWVALHPDDASAWGGLSQLWTRLDQPLRSVRAEAESRAAIGDLSGAVDRLRAGQRLARTTSTSDGVEASVIDARLRELELERRQLQVEERAGS